MTAGMDVQVVRTMSSLLTHHSQILSYVLTFIQNLSRLSVAGVASKRIPQGSYLRRWRIAHAKSDLADCLAERPLASRNPTIKFEGFQRRQSIPLRSTPTSPVRQNGEVQVRAEDREVG
jgi:hypothetical protein